MPRPIHIVDRFDVPWSGSALEAIELYSMLRGHADVRLWSEGAPDASYTSHDIEQAQGPHGPANGTLVLAGGHYQPGAWLERGRYARIIIKFNSITYAHLFRLMGRIRCAGLVEPELVFPSRMLREMMSLEGPIEPSPISLEIFSPQGKRPERPFTLGRHSRDTELKHHEDDPSLYRMLALQGHRVRIMGGTCLERYLGTDRNGIELLAAGSIPAPQFLQDLDCFFYRTYPTWLEAFGRVVLEAMACGLPVVCERRGGYVELIRDGENGFLFDTQERAFDIIRTLAADPALRERVGRCARASAEEIYSPQNQARILAWYLGPQ